MSWKICSTSISFVFRKFQETLQNTWSKWLGYLDNLNGFRILFYNCITLAMVAPSSKQLMLFCFNLSSLFSVGVIPCADRNNCSDCLRRDDICYWCSSNESCAYYQGQLKCPKNNRYYDECPVAGSLFWVLFPILAIILIPVIIYLIIWLICCCMRAAGYDPLEPTEPSAKKRPKGIRLKPGSPTNKTDELRKKYDLNDP